METPDQGAYPGVDEIVAVRLSITRLLTPGLARYRPDTHASLLEAQDRIDDALFALGYDPACICINAYAAVQCRRHRCYGLRRINAADFEGHELSLDRGAYDFETA